MDLRWKKHVPKDKWESFRVMLLQNRDVFLVLEKILDEMDKDAQKQKWSEKSYLNPAWPYLQADINGVRRTINEIKALFPKDEDYAK